MKQIDKLANYYWPKQRMQNEKVLVCLEAKFFKNLFEHLPSGDDGQLET